MTGPRLWQPHFDVTHCPDGTIVMAQTAPLTRLAPHMPERLVHWASSVPDRAYLAARDADGDWLRLTYAQVLEHVRQIAGYILAMGLDSDRPVLVLSGNDLDHALVGLAAQYAGVPYAPVSPAYSLVSTDHGKLRDIAALLDPGLIFAADGAVFDTALSAIAAPGRAVAVSRNARPGDLLLDTVKTGQDTVIADAAYDRLTPQTVGKYLFTSGSTGSPKAVINTQEMMTSNQDMIADCFAFLTDTPPVVVEWAPWSHTAGGNKVFNMVLYHGGTFYIDEGRPTPAGIMASIRNLSDIAPTWHFNVPVAYEMLVHAFETDPALCHTFFSRLDMAMYAGAGMAQHTWDALLRLSRAVTGREVLLTSALGATETGPFALMGTDRQPHAGNVGVPARGVTLKLVPNGGKLEARLKSPSITPGYFKDPVKSAEMLDAEGFYCLGDALRPADPDDLTKGFLFDGRTAENFKLNTGTWVAVGALRAALVDHFGGLIRDAVIVGENHAELGAILLPATAPPPSVTDLQDRLNSFAATATGSATRIGRIVLFDSPPDLDRGEVTDKGSLNQRAVIANRPALVATLMGGGAGVLVAR